jgi:hypothetical protein
MQLIIAQRLEKLLLYNMMAWMELHGILINDGQLNIDYIKITHCLRPLSLAPGSAISNYFLVIQKATIENKKIRHLNVLVPLVLRYIMGPRLHKQRKVRQNVFMHFYVSSFVDDDAALNVPRHVVTPDGQSSHQLAAVFSDRGRSAGVDLAILSSCDAVVVSTGSFGWWAAWLAGKTTVYYDDWPRVGSRMSKPFNATLYWPKTWIPMR